MRPSVARSGVPSKPTSSSWSVAPRADVERVRPLLDLLGRAVFHCGPLGSGHVMKSINNTITAMTFLATSEGLALGKRAGLDPAAMNDVLNESTGGSWITLNHVPQRILSGTFDDPFRLELMLKDVKIAAQLARDLEVPLPFVDHCEGSYEAAHEFAGPGKSLSELVRWVESRHRSRHHTRWRRPATSYMIIG